ncbi:non-ribosomal peptide synthetase [Thozetella sp. PMI_491]|nr:non-ribosomal peptide synthetase [Thozetella sp. PMI_491]
MDTMDDSPTVPTAGIVEAYMHPATSWLVLEEESGERPRSRPRVPDDRTADDSNNGPRVETVGERLRMAVAEVLGRRKDMVHVLDSFVDLGGDEEAAVALQKLCLAYGLELRASDILRCRNLAEVEARIQPVARQSGSGESIESVMIAPLEIHKASHLSPALGSARSHSRESSTASTASQVYISEAERILRSQKAVSDIVTTQPKAGLLEGKLVALLTLSTLVSSDTESSRINLIPQSQALFASTQIAALRKVLEERISTDEVPQVWAVLDKMPFNESGQLDRRRLRTWAQNVNDDCYYRLLGMDREEFLQPPTTEIERTLRTLVSRVLSVPQEQIGVNFSFAQLGGDELGAMDLVARCKHESVYLTVTEVLGSVPISELAQLASSRGGLAHKPLTDEETSEPFELSPMQQLYFQSTMGKDDERRADATGSYRFNQSLLLRFTQQFTLEDIVAAIEAIVGHHSMLRARFTRDRLGWSQRIVPATDSYALNHHRIRSDDELEAIIEATQARIDIETGPVFAVDYLSTHDGQQLIYLAAHHLVVDLPSWRLIIHDLDELLQTGSLLSQRSMPFNKWIDVQRAAVENTNPASLLPYEVRPGDYSYWGMDRVPNRYGDASEVSFTLSEELTSILQTTCNQVFKTESADIYLAALMLSFAQTFHDRPVPVVWSQEHGRDPWTMEMDIAETVGWFTTLCPIALKIQGADDFIQVLRALKDTRRSVAPRGQYFASKFFNPDKADPFNDWPYEIIFSYAGSLQQLERENGVMEQLGIPGRTLGSAAARRTSDIGPGVGRVGIFEFSVMIDQGHAKTKLLYNGHGKEQSRLALWFENFEHLLLEAIGRLRYHSQELTLADVPLLDVTYKGLEQFHKQRLPALNMNSVQDIEAIYPVTAVQQSILISQAQRPDTCYLHAIYEFASPSGEHIDTARICTAWQHVTSRHATLRAVFAESVTETGLYDMVILRRASPDMLFIDTAPFEDPVEELHNLPSARVSDSKPPHRLTVCKSPTRTLIKLDISAAVCDSVSIHVLLADLKRAYVTDKAIPDSVQFKYSDYLEFLRDTRHERSLNFWKDRLEGVQPCVFPRLTLQAGDQKLSNETVDLDLLYQELATFSKAHTTSIDTVLRLAWGLVLRCFSGQRNVCFGYQATGREGSVDGIRNAVGSFANLVLCSYDLAPITSVPAALGMVEEQFQATVPHQYFTPVELYHSMGMRGGEKLFNSCLTFTEEPNGLKSKFAARSNSDLKAVSHQQTFDLDIVLNTRFMDGRLIADISHRILSPEQAQSVANTFGRAIEAILQSYGGSTGALNLFSDKDYAQIVSWSQDPPDTEGWSKMVVHELVANQASKSPDAEAICAWDGSFTFRQMEEEATKLAHYLSDAGVGHHDVVPVVMEKSRWAPVAMLAVLKSGAAFVPIDSEELGLLQPIFDHLNSRVAIASGQSASILGNLFDKVVVLSDELMARLPHDDQTLSAIFDQDDAACVLFTQVSSSQVRGITFTHAALSIALLGQGHAAKICSHSRVMQLSSFNVDIALAEIFTTLVHGGCVCVPSGVERLQDFTGAVRRMNVNWTYMTPLLSRKLDPSRMPSLKVVCFRTRSLDEDTYNPWAGKANVIMAYGPQDVCPLGISFLEVIGPQHLKCIGQSFCGSMWVVNPQDQRKLMPIGAIGELVIGGPTLGNEHVSNTNDRRTLNLDIGGRDKSRYYKTGHRVRYTEGGLLEFIGSKRDELELDGRVINFPEIEQRLRRCLGQGVDVMVEALAFRGPQHLTQPMLTAFIELGENLFDGEEKLTELSNTTKERIYIARQLVETGMRNVVPAQMIPSIFIPVKHLPITPSLKVNRNRLQSMIRGLSREKLQELAVVPNPNNISSLGLKPLPLTQNEDRMRAIWARVLSVDEASIGASDTFFRIGGDEIVATKLMTECRKHGIGISITDVLRNATLTELCRSMVSSEESCSPKEEQARPDTAIPIPTVPAESDDFVERVIAPKLALNRSAIEDVAESSATQIRYIESGMLRGRANIDYFVFNFTGAVNAKKLEDACHALVKIHPILRTAFLPYNRRVYQAVVKPEAVEFKRFTYPGWRLASQTEKVIKKDQAAPIAFSSPMTRFTFIDAGKQSSLVMRLSKAQYDDLAMALLVKDLKRLYDGTDHPPHRPSYCEFIRCAQTANAQHSEDHWKMILNGASMTQVVAHTKPYQVSTRIQTVRQTIPVGSLANMGISFETVLKAGWAMALASLSGTSDIVFGELIDGRHVRLSGGHSVAGVMGPTINAIPVRVTFPESPLSPLDLLRYVHAQRVASIRYENMGFLQLVERCTPWPYWTRFSTIVQHQYEDTMITPAEPKVFRLGAASCRFTVTESRAHDICDVLVQSIMRSGGRAEFTMSFDADRVAESFINQAMKMLCEAVSMLTGVNIMQPLIPSAAQYRATPQKTIPLPQAPSMADLAAAGEPGAQNNLADLATALPPDQTRSIQNSISLAWASVLNPRALGVPDDQLHNAAFYDLWGSLIPAAQLAAQLNREITRLKIPGLETASLFTMEDVIENPTMMKQFELIVGKMRSPESKDKDKIREKEKEKDKDKEKDKEKPTAEQLAVSSIRRKPSVAVMSASTSALKGIRRLASTVTRSSSNVRTVSSTTRPTGGPTLAVPLGTPTAPAELTSPDAPQPPAGPVSATPPRLPSLPAFTSFADETAMTRGPSSQSNSSRGNVSSAETMTSGSSASSNGDDHDAGESAEHRGLRGLRTLQVPAPRGVLSPPVIRIEEEELVSPLSAVSPTNRPFDNVPTAPVVAQDVGTASSGVPSPSRGAKRRAATGLVTLSPVVEAATLEAAHA